MKSVQILVVCLNLFLLFSPSWGSVDLCDHMVDPATGLNGKQMRLVINTWAIIRQDPLASGVAIMTHFFSNNPTYQQLFKPFKDIPLQDLPDNERFQHHCIGVVNALSSVIDNLDNPSVVVDALTGLGERHKARGVMEYHYHQLAKTVIAVLEKALGKKWKPEVYSAWNLLVGTAWSIIFKVYN